MLIGKEGMARRSSWFQAMPSFEESNSEEREDGLGQAWCWTMGPKVREQDQSLE